MNATASLGDSLLGRAEGEGRRELPISYQIISGLLPVRPATRRLLGTWRNRTRQSVQKIVLSGAA